MKKTKSAQIPSYIPITSRAVLILSICAVFLFYKYILQNYPSVMAMQLMNSFDLQGLGLGVLSGVYFWTYLIVPLFVGVVLDHFGTKWITAGAILCCAIGIFIFSEAEQLNVAIGGRALIGVGVSFATIAYFKLASIWFDKKYYALLTSLVVAAAMVGAVCGQMPLAWLMQQVGWRASLAYLGWFGVVLSGLFLLFVKDKPAFFPTKHASETQESIWDNVLLIIKSKQNWLLTGYGGLAFAPLVIFCGLWGNPFLQQAYHLDKLTSSTLISLVFVGLAIASPLFAIGSSRIKNRLSFMFYSTLLSALALALVIYVQPLPIWVVGSLLFFFGFNLGAFPMVFVIGKESNPLYLAGTVISLINASDAFFDATTEPLIGALLDLFGKMGQGQGFSVWSYQLALSILPLYQIIGAFLLKGVHDEHDIRKESH